MLVPMMLITSRLPLLLSNASDFRSSSSRATLCAARLFWRALSRPLPGKLA